MKKTISLGKDFTVDLPKLLETRLLIAANSGGGKSWALRRLLEQTNGQVQQIVIDLEGEFYTLREKYDNYLLIGEDGDINADLRAASMLATKLLELGASAIIDLSELKFHERKRFVKLFLESTIDAPKDLRHPVMIVLDEAHHFAPQVGESEATGAVIDLMTRGRKRELCGVLATQRVSKLHKDAIAECNNKMFGRTAQDIDVKRTSDELGFAKNAREAFETLRNLSAGEFFAFGTAISSKVEQYKVGDVQTTHQIKGKKAKGTKPVPPKSAVKQIIAKLDDLPQEAQKKAKNEAELKKELSTAKATITRLERQGKPTKPTKADIDAALEPHLIAIASEREATKNLIDEWEEFVRRIYMIGKNTGSALLRDLEEAMQNKPGKKVSAKYTSKRVIVKPEQQVVVQPRDVSVTDTEPSFSTVEENDKPLKKGAHRMLGVLVSRYPMKFTRAQLAALAHISSRSGTFTSYLSTLRKRGLIIEEGDLIYASEVGIAHMGGDVPEPQTSEQIRDMWRANLKQGAKRMFDILNGYYPVMISREQLAEEAEISVSSGTFTSYLSSMRRNGLIEESGQDIKLSDDLYV